MQLIDSIFETICTNPERIQAEFGDITIQRKIATNLRQTILASKKYIIDGEATRAATLLGLGHPEVLNQMLKRARTPFEKIWIEWPIKIQLEVSRAGPSLIRNDTPELAGCFIQRLHPQKPLYKITFMGFATVKGKTYYQLGATSIYYNLEETLNYVSDSISIKHALKQRMQKSGVYAYDGMKSVKIEYNDYMVDTVFQSALYGTAFSTKFDEPMDVQEQKVRNLQIDKFSSHASYVLNSTLYPFYRKNIDRYNEIISESVTETAGSWRFIISLLCLINEQDYVNHEMIFNKQKRIISGKIVPYLEHRKVTLKLPHKVVTDKITRSIGESIPKRRHEVSGHWAKSHRTGDKNCNHVYVNETDIREVCVLCKHKRWWKNEYMRGDASIGFIIKDRHVTYKT